jgi:hypothetical protein
VVTFDAMKKAKKDFYIYLQKYYAGKLVAYLKDETKVLAAAKDVETLMKKLEKQKVPPSEVVLAGPIEEYGKIYVYCLSISKKDY